MGYLLEKIGETDKGVQYLLVLPRLRGVEIIFYRSNLQSVLRSFDLSSGEIGAVLRLLNKKYPSVCPSSLNGKYSIGESISRLRARGYRVYRADLRFNESAEICRLESEGFIVEKPGDNGYGIDDLFSGVGGKN